MYIRPHLDYCDVIYHIPSKLNPFESSVNLHYTMQIIESTQYQAALAVSGTWKGTNKTNCTMNSVGNPWITEGKSADFVNFIKFIIT